MAQTEKIERWRYPRFFTENINDERGVIGAEDAKHAAQVLRMRAGDCAVLCDGRGTDYLAELESADRDECVFRVLEKAPNEAEPTVYLRLFQALPKVRRERNRAVFLKALRFPPRPEANGKKGGALQPHSA